MSGAPRSDEKELAWRSKSLPPGLFPVMLTPFRADGTIDVEGLKALTHWYIASGTKGLFTVAQSSEMNKMTPEERLTTARVVLEAADGRVVGGRGT